MLRLSLKILALVMAFAIGYACREPKVQRVLVPGPTQLVYPVANRGVEIQPGLRWVNLEAQVPIFQVDNEQTIRAIAGIPPDQPGFLEGAYTSDDAGEAIYILGTWNLEAETFAHEMIHYLEHSMPDQAWRIRKAFHRLCSDKFRIDATDLQAELPQP